MNQDNSIFSRNSSSNADMNPIFSCDAIDCQRLADSVLANRIFAGTAQRRPNFGKYPVGRHGASRLSAWLAAAVLVIPCLLRAPHVSAHCPSPSRIDTISLGGKKSVDND